MSNTNEAIERIAKNVGCDVASLRSRMDNVLTQQKSVWMESGKTEEQCNLLALRVAGRQLKSEVDKAIKSGCVPYEGMFISVPRYKDWAEMAYKKMAGQLESLPDDAIHALVEQGKLVLFDYDAVNDGYTRYSNPSLDRKDTFSAGMQETQVSELPKEAVEVNSTRYFYLVWNATTPTFPSGDRNFKYGAPRPQNEKERTCLFYGHQQGDKTWAVHTFKFSGNMASINFPSFTPGTIAMRPARNGVVAYGKPNISSFLGNMDLANTFPTDPVGVVKAEATTYLGGLNDLEAYYNANKDAQDWWDQWVGMTLEVVHIDPRDNGGFIMTLGDLDIDSMAAPIDVYVPQEQENLLTFGVGSQVMVVGQAWCTRENEMRLSANGWYVVDALEPVAVEGWD